MNSIWLSAPIRTPQAVDPQAPHAAQAPHVETKAQSGVTPYFSPVVRIDPETAMAIWQVRNAETGAVVQQYPAEMTVKAYRSHMPGEAAAPLSPSQGPAPLATTVVPDVKQDTAPPDSTGPDLKQTGAPLPKEAPPVQPHT